MKQCKVLFGVLTLTLMLGCEGNDIGPNLRYLKEIVDPACFKNQFEYENGHLISFKLIFGERVETVTKFKYENNLLKQVESESDQGPDYFVELEYNSDGQRTREKVTFTYYKPFTLEPYDIIKVSDFTYDDYGNLRTKKSEFSDSTWLPSETEFEWSQGNLVRMNFVYHDELGKHSNGSRTFTYDNKRNYTNQDLAFFYVGLAELETVFSKNNSVKAMVISPGQHYEWYSYEFSYDRTGYPVSNKRKTGSQVYSVLGMSYD